MHGGIIRLLLDPGRLAEDINLEGQALLKDPLELCQTRPGVLLRIQKQRLEGGFRPGQVGVRAQEALPPGELVGGIEPVVGVFVVLRGGLEEFEVEPGARAGGVAVALHGVGEVQSGAADARQPLPLVRDGAVRGQEERGFQRIHVNLRITLVARARVGAHGLAHQAAPVLRRDVGDHHVRRDRDGEGGGDQCCKECGTFHFLSPSAKSLSST